MGRHLTITLKLMPLMFAVLLSTSVPAMAHPGGVYKNGCPINRRTAERHCHASNKKSADPNKPARAGDEGVLYNSRESSAHIDWYSASLGKKSCWHS